MQRELPLGHGLSTFRRKEINVVTLMGNQSLQESFQDVYG